jgi:hypothetical protein
MQCRTRIPLLPWFKSLTRIAVATHTEGNELFLGALAWFMRVSTVAPTRRGGGRNVQGHEPIWKAGHDMHMRDP